MLPSPNPAAARFNTRRRRKLLIFLGAGILLLLVVIVSQVSFNLTFLQPESALQTEIFAGLSILIFLLFIALSFVLLRNVFKLYVERRGGVLGAKFRTRMVLGALIISFVPVIFLYLFAYALMNRSIDKWFSRPGEELRQDAGRVADLLHTYVAANAQAEARTLSTLPRTITAFKTGDFAPLTEVFDLHVASLQGGFAAAVAGGKVQTIYHAPLSGDELTEILRARPVMAQQPPFLHVFSAGQYLIAQSAVSSGGTIVVGVPLPGEVASTINQLEASRKRYEELSLQRKWFRRLYMQILLLLTGLVLLVATWLSLFLSKLVTRPVAALAEATQKISQGEFDYRVEIAASDELGELVASFNLMAAELETSRGQIEASGKQLGSANTALEERRRQIETILESIPTGVLSLDAKGQVIHSNPAFTRLFLPTQSQVYDGSTLHDLFAPETVKSIEHLLRKSDRMGSVTSQLEFPAPAGHLMVAVTASSLGSKDTPPSRRNDAGGAPTSRASGPAARMGYVLVFEDFTDLLKAQKQNAWREVAQRVAHEIKNPLTPIALSAERIQRHLRTPPDERSLQVIQSCALAIAGAVETVRTLVDEFSTLARFPASHLRPTDIHGVVERTLAMFTGRLDGVTVQTHFDSSLPPIMADPEALKRALANLVDNAAESTQDSRVREIHISATFLEARDAVEIAVADTGHGITPEMKEKLFLPYFSTKQRGTGLGLAIVSRIIQEHKGTIRVEENVPVGARFILEIPVAAVTEPAAVS